MPIFRKARPSEGEAKISQIYKSGMIMALIDVNDFIKDLIAPVQIERSGFAWLYTQGGTILGDKTRLDYFVKNLYGDKGKTVDDLKSDFAKILKGQSVKGWSSHETSGRDISIELDDENWHIATSKINALDQTWTLAVAAPEAEATRILDMSFRQSVIMFFIVVLILVIGGSLMTRVHRRWARAEEKAFYASELEEKNRSLNELNRRMDEFVAVVSHDIRSPLNVIRGFIKMIQTSPNGPQFERETKVMLRATNRLMQLVNDILDVSKLESGKVLLAYDPLVIDEIIMESVKTMEYIAREKEQVISLSLGDATAMEGDGAKLLQVINNLIGNAVKFTPKGGQIGVTKRVEDGRVVVMVSDTGPGIPVEEQGFVFDKFEQVKHHQQGIEPGSGLGLTICKSLVELHGGAISVSSVPGQGSTFHVEIPLRRPSGGNGAHAPQAGETRHAD